MASVTVLITGATSGIGLSLFEEYVNAGHQVIACGRNKEKLSTLSQRGAQVCAFDVTVPQSIKQNTESIGELDLLILNAGDCIYIDDVMKFDGQSFANVIGTNLTSIGWLLQYLLPKVKRGGQVVLVSSSATILPFPRSEAYGASKAGLDYLANSLRLDIAKYGIDVTLVHPGFVKTPLTDKNDFPMPFLLTSEQAAKRMFKGIQSRKKYLHFPKRLTLLLKLFSYLPAVVWQSIILRNHTT
ncbi:SDR family NAD(P)-dependent oxidoreductase [Thalassotalea atypica]|uniref:SDR family NAD(P)-dependent oxidoreductase n=1 Tax=Thalassotalea atypica TaxID=2054316 RepID=UPI0025729B87|nr:SDR family NAD(P)-dependent oxidoreductase [Thalassotalea atypica]